MRLDGRAALVVGGTGALGATIADLYTEHGAAVVVADLSTVSSPHPTVSVDIADEAQVRRAVAEVNELLGGSIDILVNSAGLLSEAPVASMPLDLWQKTIARGGGATALLLASDPGGNIYVGQTLGPNSGDVMP